MYRITDSKLITRHQPKCVNIALIIAALCAGTSPARAERDSIGGRIADELKLKHAAAEGLDWGDSNDNELLDGWLVQTPPDHWSVPYAQGVVPPARCAPEDPKSCDPEFKRLACTPDDPNACGGNRALCRPLRASVRAPGQQPRTMCLGHSDAALLDSMWDVVANATSLVDVVSLHHPQGEFAAAIRNAIAYLHYKTPTESNAAPIVVRVLYSNYPQGVVPNIFSTALKGTNEVLEDLAGGFRGKASRVAVHVAMVAYSATTWNHAKIVASDGKEALVGGHNFYPTHYLEERPVHDVSLRVRGTAARHAQLFADRLWGWACKTENLTEDKQAVISGAWVAAWTGDRRVGAISKSPGLACAKAAAASRLPVVAGRGGTRILTVGRLGGASSAPGTPLQPADDALIAMIDEAKISLKIAQQNLLWGPTNNHGTGSAWGDRVMDALAGAILRGVQVDVVVSNWGHALLPKKDNEDFAGSLDAPIHDYPASRLEDLVKDLRTRVAKRAAANYRWRIPTPWGQPVATDVPADKPSEQLIDRMIVDRLHIAALRMALDWDVYPGTKIGKPSLHSKLVIADDRTFYVGSQNLYEANLSELGFIVDDTSEDRRAVKRMLDTLWAPMWRASYRTAPIPR